MGDLMITIRRVQERRHDFYFSIDTIRWPSVPMESCRHSCARSAVEGSRVDVLYDTSHLWQRGLATLRVVPFETGLVSRDWLRLPEQFRGALIALQCYHPAPCCPLVSSARGPHEGERQKSEEERSR